MRSGKSLLVAASLVITASVLVLSISLGGVRVDAADIVSVLRSKIFGSTLSSDFDSITVALIWNLRFPRVLLAFIVGAGLGASGTVIQSVLRNPLASSYTLGVSAGAALGAGLVMVTGLSVPFLLNLTLPAVGLLFALFTVFLVVSFASRVDHGFSNNTIILAGMVFSLFIHSLLTLLASVSREHMQRITLWQMGSFSLREWTHVIVLAPVTLVCIFLLSRRSQELDIMVFGDEQAQSMGVPTRKLKWELLGLSAGLTGAAVAFTGIIGFVDLIAPHVTRKIFGSSHRYVVPMSALFGGVFLVLADLIARTVVSPSELPVGVVTALIGAPFFAYVYFGRRVRGA